MAGSTQGLLSGLDWGLKTAQAVAEAGEAEVEELEADAEIVAVSAGSKLAEFKHLLNSALSRIAIFLFVILPFVFISLMHVGGHVMCHFSKWPHERGYNLMAAAMTGGAIILPAEAPSGFNNKAALACAACFGVGIFGFTVAALSNSLVAPLVHVLGIEVKDSEDEKAGGSMRTVIGRLGLLAMGIMLFNLTSAAVFGTFLSYMQGWSFFTGFKTMASLILGGGIEFHNMGVVTREGSMLYTTVGVWSWSMSGLVVAVAGDPGHKIVQKCIGLKLGDQATPSQALSQLAFLVFVVMPCTIFMVMLTVASIMKPLTTWSFEGAFWAALPAISGGAANMSSVRNPPLTLLGALIIVCASSSGFFLLSTMIGVGGELLGPIVEGPLLGPYLGKRRTVGHSILALFGISAFMIPTLVFCSALCVGTMMALVMGWPISDGILWCADVQLGGGMDLVLRKPTTHVGMLFGAVVVAWSIGISILAIGLSGSPVVEPLIESLGMSIDPEELRSFAIFSKSVQRSERTLVGETSYGSVA